VARLREPVGGREPGLHPARATNPRRRLKSTLSPNLDGVPNEGLTPRETATYCLRGQCREIQELTTSETKKQWVARKHAAIFVRQGEPRCPSDVRAMREEATRLRWKRCGIEAIFVDHFADAAQLLYEIGYCMHAGDG
jgi:hypothetical protein